MDQEPKSKRRVKGEEFREEVPLTSKIKESMEKAKVALSIILTDRGLYLSATNRLKAVYNGAVTKIRKLFRRK